MSSSSMSCLLVHLLVLVVEARALQPSKVFNVKKFGAVPDGKTDNSKVKLYTRGNDKGPVQ